MYDTIYMLAAIEELPLEHTFFKSRYFPTDDVTDAFNTSKVLVDYGPKPKQGKRIAIDGKQIYSIKKCEEESGVYRMTLERTRQG